MLLVRRNQFVKKESSNEESAGELKLGYFTFSTWAVAKSNLSPSLPAFKGEQD